MPSFVTITSGTTAQAQDVNQLILAMNGTPGSGVPVSLTAVNDSVNFALAVKNADPTNSRSLQVLRANNNVLLQADASGVIVSPDGGATTAQVVNTTLAQTLTNKTFTSPIITSPNFGRAMLWLVGSASGTAFPANLTANGAYQNLTGGAITLSLNGGLTGGNVYVKGAISMTVNAARDFFIGYSYNGGATVQVAHHTGTGVNSWVTIPLSFGITSALTGTATVLQIQVKGTNLDVFAFDTANAATIDVYEMR